MLGSSGFSHWPPYDSMPSSQVTLTMLWLRLPSIDCWHRTLHLLPTSQSWAPDLQRSVEIRTDKPIGCRTGTADTWDRLSLLCLLSGNNATTFQDAQGTKLKKVVSNSCLFIINAPYPPHMTHTSSPSQASSIWSLKCIQDAFSTLRSPVTSLIWAT